MENGHLGLKGLKHQCSRLCFLLLATLYRKDAALKPVETGHCQFCGMKIIGEKKNPKTCRENWTANTSSEKSLQGFKLLFFGGGGFKLLDYGLCFHDQGFTQVTWVSSIPVDASKETG